MTKLVLALLWLGLSFGLIFWAVLRGEIGLAAIAATIMTWVLSQ